MAGLFISGLTAIPIDSLLEMLLMALGEDAPLFLTSVHGVQHSLAAAFPFLSYATDWLAFGLLGLIPLIYAYKQTLKLINIKNI